VTERTPFSLFALIRRNLRYYWRGNLAVGLGCAAAAAVLTGSLLVGDSARGSLRDVALERLGPVSYAVTAPGLFREGLAEEVASDPAVAALYDEVAPALLLEGSCRHAATGRTIPGVSVVGVESAFWSMFPVPGARPDARRVVLNAALADDLGAKVGDDVLLTLGRGTSAPIGTIFARADRQHTVVSLRLRVKAIIPCRGPGAFSLQQTRGRPRNLYVALDWLQERLGRPERANTLLFARGQAPYAAPNAEAALTGALERCARLADYGLRLVPNPRRGYLSLESERLVLPGAAVVRALETAEAEGMRAVPTSVYLANALFTPDRGEAGGVPYSVVASFDGEGGAPFGPLKTPTDEGVAAPGPGEILLTDWAAEDLQATPSETITMIYYTSDARGALRTARRSFTLKAVVALAGPAQDAGVVPAYEGITDATRMQDWSPPFPVDLTRIRPKDEAYWERFRTTPKAYLARETLRELWQPEGAVRDASGVRSPSRWNGWVTSVRVAAAGGGDLEAARARLERAFVQQAKPADHGILVQPVRRQAIEGAKGSSDYGMLFVGMSLFLVGAAAGLVGLLLRLAITRRAAQFGVLLSAGFAPRRAARTLEGEALLVALGGAALGVPLGVGYAALIILALRTSWAGAVADFPFSLHVTGGSLLIGMAVGIGVSWLAIRWATRLLRRTPPLVLLAGWQALAVVPAPGGRALCRGLGVALSAAAVGVAGLSAAGLLDTTVAFFLCGALLLCGALALLAALFQRKALFPRTAGVSLSRLAWRGASRNWLRSLLTCGLTACASFVIVAVAANRRDFTRFEVGRRDSGTGGFALVGRSAAPVFSDLNTPSGRAKAGWPMEAEPDLEGTRIFSLRVSEGDDISCLNIQRPMRPRVLGVPDDLITRGGFTFAAHAARGPDDASESPWLLLRQALPSEPDADVVPAFADAASAQWILHADLGQDVLMTDRRGRTVRLRLVGLLANSIFQSDLLVSEAAFRQHFGPDGGYGCFLIETSPGREGTVAEALRTHLGEMGLTVRRTAEVLAAFARVQNTYLSTFQTLGGLGLLLGTFGVVMVLLRGIVERRAELAMLMALGWRRRQIVAVMAMENVLLLLIGLGVGTGTAVVSVAPHLASAMAGVNWPSLLGALAACAVVGGAACLAASEVSLRRDLIPALRSE